MQRKKTNVLNDVMPDDIGDGLRSAGDDLSGSQWDVGRFTLSAIRRLGWVQDYIGNGGIWVSLEVSEQIMGKGIMDVYRWAAVEARVRPRTAREYTAVWRFYEKDFAELQHLALVLSFSHFRFAMAYPQFTRRILELAVRQMDNSGGRPASVPWLEANFRRCLNLPGAVSEVEEVMDVQDVLAGGPPNPQTPPNPHPSPQSPGSHFLQHRFGRISDFIRNSAQRFSLPDPDVLEINDALERIEQVFKRACVQELT